MSIMWEEGCVVVMWCLGVNSVGGGVWRCYVVFGCPFYGGVRGRVRGIIVSILWEEGCVVVMW